MLGRHFFSKKAHARVDVQSIPYVPSKIKLKHLSTDGCLLTSEQLDLLEQLKPALTEERRYSKEEISQLIKARLVKEVVWPYSLIHHDDRFYAIYKGEKRGSHLGKGEHGKVKLAQCLDTKVFYALKLQDNADASKVEFKLLRRAAQTPQKSKLPMHTTKAGQTQSMILMKLARGLGMDQITDKEIDAAYLDDEDNQCITGLMSPALRIQLALDTLKRLDELHVKHHILHRDLQPGNIILDLVGQRASLIDYGLSLALAVPHENPMKLSGSVPELKGSTRNYSPQLRRHIPEARRASSSGELMPVVTYTRESEMYAIGITLASFFHLLDDIPEDLVARPEDWESHLITDEQAEIYLPYYDILPIAVYRQILALVRKMTDADEARRIEFSEAIQELTSILNQMKQQGDKIVVGLLDLAKVGDDGLASVIDSIKKSGIHEVCLVDSSGNTKNLFELLGIQHQLQAAELRVVDSYVASADRKKIEDEVAKLLSQRPVPSCQQWIAVEHTLTAAAAAASSTVSRFK